MFQQSRTEQPDRAFPFLRRLDLIIAEDLDLRLRIGLGEDRYEHVEQDEAHQQHEENEEQRAGHGVGALQIEVLKVAEQGAEEGHHRAGGGRVVQQVRAEGHVERLARGAEDDEEHQQEVAHGMICRRHKQSEIRAAKLRSNRQSRCTHRRSRASSRSWPGAGRQRSTSGA